MQAKEENQIDGSRLCPKCALNLPSEQEYLQHLKAAHHVSNEYRCTICKFEASTSKNIEVHMHAHEKGFKFQCKICFHLSSSASNLLRHIRYKHTHDKPFQCQFCSYSAVEEHKLNEHMDCHTGQMKHKCKVCDAAFRTGPALKLHETVHSERRECLCVLCFQMCKIVTNLHSHLRTCHMVENLHIEGVHSFEKHGIPETVKLYLDHHGVTEEDAIREGNMKYYQIKAEYRKCYSKTFKSIAPIIWRMECSRDGENIDTSCLRRSKKMKSDNKFLASLIDTKEPILAKIIKKRKFEQVSEILNQQTQDVPLITNTTVKGKNVGKEKERSHKKVRPSKTIKKVKNRPLRVVQEPRVKVPDPMNEQDLAIESIVKEADKEYDAVREKQENLDEEFGLAPITDPVKDVPETIEVNSTAVNNLNSPSEYENCTQLVSEVEDSEKRASLLSAMKTGGFGNMPCVIKVLEDGTIMDCTSKYENFLPCQGAQ